MKVQKVEDAIAWYLPLHLGEANIPSELCPTRDIFQARLDTLYQETINRKLLPENEAALLTAVVGEIGNNCFDHNLGQWPDLTGCWFSWIYFEEKKSLFVIVADRGQGIRNSLRRVRPDLKGEDEALQLAFEKRISGRSPEQRGNGLKFVRSVINGSDQRALLFYSGSASIGFGGCRDLEDPAIPAKMKKKQGTGTFAVVFWKNA
jgi:hypothetical protein